MPRFLRIATIIASVLIAPVAQAYSTEPTFTILDITLTISEELEAGEVCIPPMTPELVAALAIDSPAVDTSETIMACAAK